MYCQHTENVTTNSANKKDCLLKCLPLQAELNVGAIQNAMGSTGHTLHCLSTLVSRRGLLITPYQHSQQSNALCVMRTHNTILRRKDIIYKATNPYNSIPINIFYSSFYLQHSSHDFISFHQIAPRIFFSLHLQIHQKQCSASGRNRQCQQLRWRQPPQSETVFHSSKIECGSSFDGGMSFQSLADR